ncbi:MAG: AAA family ATPase [Caldilineaceae bacterium]|nr:AAA family ATPase [Caldilineaceae bacterium]
MRRILLTGISGVGKSTVTEELARRGYNAVDADSDVYSAWVAVPDELAAAGTPVTADRDWVWCEDRMAEPLSTTQEAVLFVSGCAANMGKFLRQFDQIILLSAPAPVIAERLRTRTNNPYGKDPIEIERVLALKESVEPRLRDVANHEIDTTASLEQVMSSLLHLVQAP